MMSDDSFQQPLQLESNSGGENLSLSKLEFKTKKIIMDFSTELFTIAIITIHQTIICHLY